MLLKRNIVLHKIICCYQYSRLAALISGIMIPVLNAAVLDSYS